jgi:hypothetical protein
MPRILTLFSFCLVALAVSATAAFAVGSLPQAIKPTSKQKTAIIKAWAQGAKPGPSKCYTVAISKQSQYLAGLEFNSRASGCTKSAFDGASILWGRSTTWNMLTAGSAIGASNCKALQRLMGVNAYEDLSTFVGHLGCVSMG